MTGLCPPPVTRRRVIVPLPAPAPAPRRRWWRGLAIVLLAVGLIVCHGCHFGDHDDELIVWLLDR